MLHPDDNGEVRTAVRTEGGQAGTLSASRSRVWNRYRKGQVAQPVGSSRSTSCWLYVVSCSKRLRWGDYTIFCLTSDDITVNTTLFHVPPRKKHCQLLGAAILPGTRTHSFLLLTDRASVAGSCDLNTVSPVPTMRMENIYTTADFLLWFNIQILRNQTCSGISNSATWGSTLVHWPTLFPPQPFDDSRIPGRWALHTTHCPGLFEVGLTFRPIYGTLLPHLPQVQ